MVIRWRLLAAMGMLQMLVVWVGFPLLWMEPGEVLDAMLDRDMVLMTLVMGGVIVSLQAAFLVPVRRPGLSSKGKSLWFTCGAAGFAAAALFTALTLTFYEVVLTLFDVEKVGDVSIYLVAMVAQGVAWAIATPLLISFVRRDMREQTLGRLAAWLFTGTIIEVVAIIPLDVMIRRKTDCYCFAGTFFALVITGGVGLFVLGPAVLLPLFAERRKRWYGEHCGACGYDMRGNPNAECCPECGAGWKEAKGDATEGPVQGPLRSA